MEYNIALMVLPSAPVALVVLSAAEVILQYRDTFCA